MGYPSLYFQQINLVPIVIPNKTNMGHTHHHSPLIFVTFPKRMATQNSKIVINTIDGGAMAEENQVLLVENMSDGF